MRPKSIALFEKIFLAGAAASALSILLNYGAWREYAISRGGAAASPLIGLVIGLIVNAFLWFCIARKASNAVRWLLCVFVAFALAGLPASITKGAAIGPSYLILFVLATVLQTLSCAPLFRNDARQWFRHKGKPPEPVSDVFG